MEVVVARYNEDVSWTKLLPADARVRIYNKGAPFQEPFDENVTQLPNVGREGHTYYSHIVDNYDTLSEHTVFLQGNPFDHSPNALDNIAYIADKKYDFVFISEYLINCNLTGCRHHAGLPLIDVHEKLFGERLLEKPFVFGAGAQFSVSRDVIRQRPRDFYQRIVDLLAYDVNPIEGFVIERFHGLILGNIREQGVL